MMPQQQAIRRYSGRTSAANIHRFMWHNERSGLRLIQFISIPQNVNYQSIKSLGEQQQTYLCIDMKRRCFVTCLMSKGYAVNVSKFVKHTDDLFSK